MQNFVKRIELYKSFWLKFKVMEIEYAMVAVIF